MEESNNETIKVLEKYAEVLQSNQYVELATKRGLDEIDDTEYKKGLIQLNIPEEDAQTLVDYNNRIEDFQNKSGMNEYMEIATKAINILMSNESLSDDTEILNSKLDNNEPDIVEYLQTKHGLSSEDSILYFDYLLKTRKLESSSNSLNDLDDTQTMSEEDLLKLFNLNDNNDNKS